MGGSGSDSIFGGSGTDTVLYGADDVTWISIDGPGWRIATRSGVDTVRDVEQIREGADWGRSIESAYYAQFLAIDPGVFGPVVEPEIHWEF